MWLVGPVLVVVVRSLAGSFLCSGQVCHGVWHGHCHLLTGQERLHWLHHVLLSRLAVSKTGFVPESWWGHFGHRSRMAAGRGSGLMLPVVMGVGRKGGGQIV